MRPLGVTITLAACGVGRAWLEESGGSLLGCGFRDGTPVAGSKGCSA